MTQAEASIWQTPAGREMRQILARLELISNGVTTAWDTTGGGDTLRLPRTGDPNPPHLTYRTRFEQATTDHERAELIEQARHEYVTLTGRYERRRPTGETKEQRDARIIREGRGWPVDEVARHFRCGPRDVVNARRNAGVRLDNGNPRTPSDTADDQADKLAQAEHLAATGMSRRQIALMLGLSKDKVHRHLSKAA